MVSKAGGGVILVGYTPEGLPIRVQVDSSGRLRLDLKEDLGDLAARLGAILPFDRNGDIIWADGFENGLGGWLIETSGTANAAVTLSTTTKRSGGCSAKFSIDAGGGDWARLRAGLGYEKVSKFGLEVSLVTALSGRVTLQLSDFTGTYEHRFACIFYFGPMQLYRLNATGGETLLASNIPWYSQLKQFSTVKLVVDMATHKYSRLIVNNTTYDLSNFDRYSIASIVSPNTQIAIESMNIADAPSTLYIDDVIFTENEP